MPSFPVLAGRARPQKPTDLLFMHTPRLFYAGHQRIHVWVRGFSLLVALRYGKSRRCRAISHLRRETKYPETHSTSLANDFLEKFQSFYSWYVFPAREDTDTGLAIVQGVS